MIVDASINRAKIRGYIVQGGNYMDKNGRPTRKKLDSLGLNDMAEELVRPGKISE